MLVHKVENWNTTMCGSGFLTKVRSVDKYGLRVWADKNLHALQSRAPLIGGLLSKKSLGVT